MKPRKDKAIISDCYVYRTTIGSFGCTITFQINAKNIFLPFQNINTSWPPGTSTEIIGDYLHGIMDLFGVNEWNDLKGQECRIIHRPGRVYAFGKKLFFRTKWLELFYRE